jgi:hypothetical protein
LPPARPMPKAVSRSAPDDVWILAANQTFHFTP